MFFIASITQTVRKCVFTKTTGTRAWKMPWNPIPEEERHLVIALYVMRYNHFPDINIVYEPSMKREKVDFGLH